MVQDFYSYPETASCSGGRTDVRSKLAKGILPGDPLQTTRQPSLCVCPCGLLTYLFRNNRNNVRVFASVSVLTKRLAGSVIMQILIVKVAIV
jgi:hypothetical protein